MGHTEQNIFFRYFTGRDLKAKFWRLRAGSKGRKTAGKGTLCPDSFAVFDGMKVMRPRNPRYDHEPTGGAQNPCPLPALALFRLRPDIFTKDNERRLELRDQRMTFLRTTTRASKSRIKARGGTLPPVHWVAAAPTATPQREPVRRRSGRLDLAHGGGQCCVSRPDRADRLQTRRICEENLPALRAQQEGRLPYRARPTPNRASPRPERAQPSQSPARSSRHGRPIAPTRSGSV